MRVIGWQDIKPEYLKDIQAATKELFDTDLLDKYYQLLKDNNLDPDLHEPAIAFAEGLKQVTIIIGVKPIKRIGGVPINQVKFTD